MNTCYLPPDHIGYDAHGQGRPVVFLHAFPHDRAMWRNQIEVFSPHYRTIAPDLRGFGDTSPFSVEPSIECLADDVETLLSRLKVDEPVILVGLSMGGYVALNFVHRYPWRLGALVLADTRAEPDTAEGQSKRDEMIAFAGTHSMAEIAAKMMPGQLGSTTQTEHPQIVNVWENSVCRQTQESVIAGSLALRNRGDTRPWLNSIAVPTLLLFGAEDALAPPSVIETLHNGIPDVRLVTIAGAGHLSNIEAPLQWNEALSQFLQGLPDRH